VREPAQRRASRALVFWTAYGAESLLCNVAALPGPPAEPATQLLVLVSIVNGAPRALAPAPDKLSPAPAPVKAAPLATADDAATMTKIARAIRSGFAGSKTDAATAAAGLLRGGACRAPAERAAYVSSLPELRTPSAIAAAEIMKDQRFGVMGNERYRSYTSDIHDNARHALAVINRLLGGENSGTAAQLESAELDLNALAQSAVSAMRPLAEDEKLNLGTEFHAHLPRVVADAMTVKQILFNLLTNAVKFTKPGGDVRVVTGLGFDRSVFVAVQDTGCGMTSEAITRALESESPLKPQRSEAGGHGIGLPLARGLAEANGARLEIDSAPNEGTAVALIFPKDRVAQASAKQRARPTVAN
jgi:signal transduction histidine kinase